MGFFLAPPQARLVSDVQWLLDFFRSVRSRRALSAFGQSVSRTRILFRIVCVLSDAFELQPWSVDGQIVCTNCMCVRPILNTCVLRSISSCCQKPCSYNQRPYQFTSLRFAPTFSSRMFAHVVIKFCSATPLALGPSSSSSSSRHLFGLWPICDRSRSRIVACSSVYR